MNPLDWLKALYEAFGVSHPRASLVSVMALGAIIFGGVWKLAATQYAKTVRSAHVAPTTGNATTQGSQSPAITGSDNTVTYGGDGATQSPPKQKD